MDRSTCEKCRGYLPHCVYVDKYYYRCRYCDVMVANTGGFRLAKHERRCPRTPKNKTRCYCLQPPHFEPQH